MARDVFLVEAGGQTVLFSGTAGLIMEIAEEERERVAALINRPSFHLQELHALFPELEVDRLPADLSANGEAPSDSGEFRPDGAMLFPTLGCHLRCTYCYSNGGDQKINMDREVARATIDFIVANAVANGNEECGLEFHGGGEPTWNWPVFEFSLGYLEAQAKKVGVRPAVSLATNGMLSTQQIDQITSRIPRVQVSLDGTAEIQNAQRPTPTQKGSFPVVSRTISTLLERGVTVTIHSVITERSMGRIPEIVRFFGERFPGAAVQVEPAFPCGRGLTTGEQFPEITLFVQGFIEALRIAEGFSMELAYSGVNPSLTEIRGKFCGVTVPNFIVTPTGLVTACTEVAVTSHPFAEYFIYGRLERATGQFVFDQAKIERLRSYQPSRHPECGECFARFTCAGECLVKNITADGTSRPSLVNPRCAINRELTQHFIADRIRSKEEMTV